MDEVYRVYVPRLTRAGEFRDKAEADELAGKLGPAAVVVPRFSREEQDLLRRDLHSGTPHD